MAQKKAGEVDGFLSRPDTSFPIVLLYGPDPGLVSERADTVARLSGTDLSDAFAAVSMNADELERDIGRLFDEARTVSMFGGRRLIRVRHAGNGKNLADAVSDLAAAPPAETTIVIEAGDLKKSSALRVNAERGRASVALPCFPDEARALDRMIDEELDLSGLVIERAAREALRQRLGADRLASRGEVRKLCLYARGQAGITEADVIAVVGDVSLDTVDEAIDAAACGDVRKIPELVDRLVSSGTASFQLHQGLMRYFHGLLSMRQDVERSGATLSSVVERRRPHFRRRQAMETALGAWSEDEIAEVLSRIEADILVSRKEAALSTTIMRRTLVDIGVGAARNRTRRR
jgi:DNA polymerase III subunit delta